MREVAELHVADELVDAERLVLQHLLEALLGIADHDHVGVVEDLGIEVAVLLHLQEREDLVLLRLGEVRHLPLERELGEVLVPPPHRVPDPVRLALVHRLGAVHERVGRHLVRRHARDRRRRLGREPVLLDVLRHLLDGLEDRERQQAQAQAARDGRAPVTRGSHPAGGMRILHGLRSHHPLGEVEVLAVVLEVLALPHADDGLDGFLPLLPARLPVDAECDLLHRGRPAGAPLHSSPGQDVGRRHLLGHAHRRGERVRHERDAEPEADLLGALRERADDDLGRGRVRSPLAEVVLDVPCGVEAQLVGELDLLERLLVGLLLRLSLAPRVGPGPGLGDVDLVEHVEFHGLPLGVVAAGARTKCLQSRTADRDCKRDATPRSDGVSTAEKQNACANACGVSYGPATIEHTFASP